MGDFGGSGYRSEYIAKQVYGINYGSEESFDFEERVKNEFIDGNADCKTTDEEIIERMK